MYCLTKERNTMAKLGQYGKQLSEMTEQQVFDVVVEHLLTQQMQSTDDQGDCVYMGDNICCAAAPFIQDYDPSLEGNDWDNVVDTSCADDNHQDFISLLQNIHDSEFDVQKWPDALLRLAKSHELDTSVVEKFQ